MTDMSEKNKPYEWNETFYFNKEVALDIREVIQGLRDDLSQRGNVTWKVSKNVMIEDYLTIYFPEDEYTEVRLEIDELGRMVLILVSAEKDSEGKSLERKIECDDPSLMTENITEFLRVLLGQINPPEA